MYTLGFYTLVKAVKDIVRTYVRTSQVVCCVF